MVVDEETTVPWAALLGTPPAAGTSTIRLLPVSAMITSPAPSTATPAGLFSPVPMTTGDDVGVANSSTELAPASATNTPADENATDLGEVKPLPTLVTVPGSRVMPGTVTKVGSGF